MKLVQDTTQGLGSAASQLSSALETAVASVSELATTIAPFAAQRMGAVETALKSLGTDLAALPKEFDPAAVLDALQSGSTKSRDLLAGFGTALQALPQSLSAAAASVQPALAQARMSLEQQAQGCEAALEKAQSLSSEPSTVADVESAVASWWQQASQAVEVVNTYAARVAVTVVPEEADALADQARGDLMQLQETVLQACESFRAGLSVAAAGPSVEAGPSGQGEASSSATQPDESSASASLEPFDSALDQARALIPEIIQKMREPLNLAKEQADSVGKRLSGLSEALTAQLEKSILPLQEIPQYLSELIMKLASVVADFKAALTAIQKILEGLVDQVLLVLAKLDALPALFDPVRTSIDAALAQIATVVERIPLFISQSIGALTMAAGELDQAMSLCNNAIEVCTRYMTKAPLLIPARALFMGIKALIPTIQASITAAKGSVQQVGSSAQSGLGQAAGSVKLLYPLLDTAVAQIKAASATLATLVHGLEGSMSQGMARIDGVGVQVETQIKGATTRLEASSTGLANLPAQYLKRVPIDSTLKEASVRWAALTQGAMAPVQAATEQLGPKLELSIVEAERSLRPRIVAAMATARSASAQAAANAPRHQAGADKIAQQFQVHDETVNALQNSALAVVERERARLQDVFAQVVLRLQDVHLAVKPAPGAGTTSSGTARG